MVKNSIFLHSLKNVFRSRINIISIILLSISSAIIIFGVSYMVAINNLWADWSKKSIDFRTFAIYYDVNKFNENEIIKKVENIDHVQEVSTFSSYQLFGTATEYVNDKFDGQLILRGVSKNGVKVAKGENLENYDGENVLICSKQFNPNSQAYYVDYDINSLKDLSNSIGKNIEINIINSGNIEKFKIIGLYDSNYNYSSGDTCYTSFDTIKKLNKKYQSELYNDDTQEDSLIAVIDDYDNSNIVSEDLKELGLDSVPIIKINTKIGTDVVKVITIIAVVLCLVSFLTILILSLKIINNQIQEYALLKALGYTTKKINLIKTLEFLIIDIISLILSIFLSKITFIIYYKINLANMVEYSRMSTPLNFMGILYSIFILSIISIIISYITSRKIEKVDIITSLEG